MKYTYYVSYAFTAIKGDIQFCGHEVVSPRIISDSQQIQELNTYCLHHAKQHFSLAGNSSAVVLAFNLLSTQDDGAVNGH